MKLLRDNGLTIVLLLATIGTIIGMGTGFVAGIVAMVCALVTIAVAWIFYRPIIGIALLAIAAFLIWKLWQKKHNVKM